jgi:hypothetical protein
MVRSASQSKVQSELFAFAHKLNGALAFDAFQFPKRDFSPAPNAVKRRHALWNFSRANSVSEPLESRIIVICVPWRII